MISFRRSEKTVFIHIARRGDDEEFVPVEALQPTGHPHGTIERVEVMRRRIEAGQELFHPLDETRCGTFDECCACAKFCQDSQERLRDERRADFEAKEDKRIKAEAKRKREAKREALVQRREQLDKFYR